MMPCRPECWMSLLGGCDVQTVTSILVVLGWKHLFRVGNDHCDLLNVSWRLIMGCFDEVSVICPSCGGPAVFQSKAGSCVMATFRLGEIPPDIAGDLDGEWSECEQCGREVKLTTQVMVIPEWQ